MDDNKTWIQTPNDIAKKNWDNMKLSIRKREDNDRPGPPTCVTAGVTGAASRPPPPALSAESVEAGKALLLLVLAAKCTAVKEQQEKNQRAHLLTNNVAPKKTPIESSAAPTERKNIQGVPEVTGGDEPGSNFWGFVLLTVALGGVALFVKNLFSR
ncbi:MAG: hypothetical protein ACXQT4_04570 [Methanotrichaceae archaeon]